MTDEAANITEYAAGSEQIDLTAWSFAVGHNRILAKDLTDILRQEFTDNPPRITFPFVWSAYGRAGNGIGGPAVTDPVMLHVHLPLAPDRDSSITFECSLEGVVDHLIMGGMDSEKRTVCAKIAARLRELAQKLDDKVDE